MIIQYLLIIAVIVILVLFLRNHGTSKGRASNKIAFVLFVVFGVFAVLEPDYVTDLARLVGVGRGTDLVLYGLVVAFTFVVINTYLRFRDWEQRQARLARAVAISAAEAPADDLAAP
jgi:small membrane protein